jgi:hypothetical protein
MHLIILLDGVEELENPIELGFPPLIDDELALCRSFANSSETHCSRLGNIYSLKGLKTHI